MAATSAAPTSWVILRPGVLFLEVLVHHALERGLVDFRPAHLVLQRLQEQLFNHLLIHCMPPRLVAQALEQGVCRTMETPATAHSIRRSARSHSGAGICRPIAAADLALTAS